jgi:hypothetical protein
MSNDYFKEIDLNPAVGGLVNNPLDPRAMHYFGFASEGQDLQIVGPITGPQPRIAVSWQYANQPTAAPVPPQPLIDGILDFNGGGPGLHYEFHHDRNFVIVWYDPTGATPTGPVLVRIRAWATK